jgi:hypothetical protein
VRCRPRDIAFVEKPPVSLGVRAAVVKGCGRCWAPVRRPGPAAYVGACRAYSAPAPDRNTGGGARVAGLKIDLDRVVAFGGFTDQSKRACALTSHVPLSLPPTESLASRKPADEEVAGVARRQERCKSDLPPAGGKDRLGRAGRRRDEQRRLCGDWPIPRRRRPGSSCDKL